MAWVIVLFWKNYPWPVARHDREDFERQNNGLAE
jgi:hypothetical protein